MNLLGMFGLPGGAEWLVIGIVLLLLFGKRLPEVARSLGKGVVEFKRGLHGVQDDIERAVDSPPALEAPPRPASPDRVASSQNSTDSSEQERANAQ